MSKKPWTPMMLRIALIIAFLMGQYWPDKTGESFMTVSPLMFFTNQSNWWIVIITAVFLVYDLISLRRKNPLTPPNWLYTLKFMCTVAITLTFLVFGLLLTPEMIMKGNYSYLFTVGNLCVHNLVPILAIIDWCLTGWRYTSTKRSFLLGAILPLWYVFFVFACVLMGIGFGKVGFVPYFFFDFQKNGWFTLGGGRLGVVWWIILLTLVVLAMSYGFIAIKNAVAKKKGKTVQ